MIRNQLAIDYPTKPRWRKLKSKFEGRPWVTTIRTHYCKIKIKPLIYHRDGFMMDVETIRIVIKYQSLILSTTMLTTHRCGPTPHIDTMVCKIKIEPLIYHRDASIDGVESVKIPIKIIITLSTTCSRWD